MAYLLFSYRNNLATVAFMFFTLKNEVEIVVFVFISDNNEVATVAILFLIYICVVNQLSFTLSKICYRKSYTDT